MFVCALTHTKNKIAPSPEATILGGVPCGSIRFRLSGDFTPGGEVGLVQAVSFFGLYRYLFLQFLGLVLDNV